MVRTHQKKTRRYRGKRTFGTGKIGTKRKKGQRGGTGLTTGKFKHKWSKAIKMRNLGYPGPEGDEWRIGKHGFKRPQRAVRREVIHAINIKDIELNLDKWLEQGKIQKQRNKYIINLAELGYDKLLGKGKVTKKMEITVDSASEGAIEKLEEAKCVLNLLSAQE